MKPSSRLLSVLSLVLLALASCALSPVHAESDASPAIAVSIDSHGPTTHQALTIIWPDGTIVWSKDQEKGGPPYLTAKIDPAKTTALLDKLEKDGVFKKTSDDLVHLGPDASYHRIDLLRGKQEYTYLASWHELSERNPNVIATSHGIQSEPDKAKREKLIASDDPAYKSFRTLWKDIRTSITGLIPKDGKPYQGELKWEFPRD